MKFVLRSLFLISVMTLGMTSYVHGQVTLFRLSYVLNNKGDLLAHRMEEYKRLKFEVESLRAPALLEQRMNDLKMDLGMPREIGVIRMPPLEIPADVVPEVITRQLAGERILGVLGRLVKVAQAKTDR
jgi:hypothetical protein